MTGAPTKAEEFTDFVAPLASIPHPATPAVATLTVVTFALDQARHPDGRPPG